MAGKQKDATGYDRLKKAVSDNTLSKLYIFHGEERYLMERYIGAIRKQICPDGLGGFNYRRFEGRALSITELDSAVNTLPAFAERTLIEIYDYEIFVKGRGGGKDWAEDDTDSESSDDSGSEDKGAGKSGESGESESSNSGGDESGLSTGTGSNKAIADAEKKELLELFSNLPDYVCLVFIYDTIAFKPDRRRRINTDLLSKADVVEFAAQEMTQLRKWITEHFEDAGKHISVRDAEYMVFITGGDMFTLLGEIEKVSAYSESETVSRADIDAVTTPVLDAVAYKMTDALVAGNTVTAMQILDELLRMREVPQKILFSVSLKMRQLLAARVWLESGLDKDTYMEVCGIKFDFQASQLLSSARKMSLSGCRSAVQACSESAYQLNSSSSPEACLIELVAKLALLRK